MAIGKTRVIVIGAGATGIICARELSNRGFLVTVLEAKDYVGGRAHSIHPESFSHPIETGAEFIHGDLPITKSLVREAGLSIIKVEGQSWHRYNGKLSTSQYFIEEWDLLMEKLQALEQDISIGEFLKKEFSDSRFDALRRSVVSFVEGYDAASVSNASAFALREEWLNEDFDAQYRIEGGYSKLMNYIKTECDKNGVRFSFSEEVTNIQWDVNKVLVRTKAGKFYESEKVIITIPIGVLQSENTILFKPEIKDRFEAIHKLGYGSVVKFLIEFKEKFWETLDPLNDGIGLKKMGFFFSDASIPTWWTQYPTDSTLLTGWLAGPSAEANKHKREEARLTEAVKALAYIFGFSEDQIRSKIKAWRIINWTEDVYSKGAYTYPTVEAPQARKQLILPVKDVIYFAGEGLYEGPEGGTVEAAFRSGLKTASELKVES
ncbi:monoamine oxidase [Sporocytophaga myxococcoides]|uniref:Tryptophan 2-monooxygenase n=1 Tax=Sporocytophaga myxococcoides TaxID=153721 RepID=A0A098LP12_9BACT|nr:NAD(P)/FAD-dependent oxidoreductase [Sporocytophaga myxococcoides]GAL87738.1 monoamine oxidase [Sporocytophaga myxococcoides]